MPTHRSVTTSVQGFDSRLHSLRWHIATFGALYMLELKIISGPIIACLYLYHLTGRNGAMFPPLVGHQTSSFVGHRAPTIGYRWPERGE